MNTANITALKEHIVTFMLNTLEYEQGKLLPSWLWQELAESLAHAGALMPEALDEDAQHHLWHGRNQFDPGAMRKVMVQVARGEKVKEVER